MFKTDTRPNDRHPKDARPNDRRPKDAGPNDRRPDDAPRTNNRSLNDPRSIGKRPIDSRFYDSRLNDSRPTDSRQIDSRAKLNNIERNRRKELFDKARPATNVKRGDILRGKVYNITEDGAFILTDDNFIGFIHASEQPHPLKTGMNVEGRVTFVRPDGRLNLSLRLQKEIARVADAERILEYLKKRGGSMPFNDNSPPEAVKDRFGISKSAFKRALGKLYKDGVVIERDGWVILKEEEQS